MFSLSPAQSNPFIATNRPHHTHFYTPVTPSPLRTSRNANLMPASPGNAGNGNSSPIIASSPLGKFAVRDEQEQDENVIPGAFFGGSMNRNDGSMREEGNSGVQKTQSGISSRHTGPTGGAAGMQKTPETLKQYYPSMNGSAGGNSSALVTPPDSTSSNSGSNANLSGRVSGSITQSGFVFGNGQATATANSASFTFTGGQGEKKEGSVWESRARGASPVAAIVRHAAQGREMKKSQFLDRIRRRRDDARSEGVGDQVLRMDFVRERRVWEGEMRRRALAEGGGGDADMLEEDEVMSGEDRPDGEREGGQHEEEMSPTEEYDPEAEELGIYYDYDYVTGTGMNPGTQAQAQARRRSRTVHADGDEDFIVDDEDEEYEEVFREFILRDQWQGQGQGQHRESASQQQQMGGHNTHDQHQQPGNGEYEAGMDLS
ncbi:hypothetical protein H2202_006055 [Exophiala xenobiotica]|nr:hypothetical protein H2202_006055 [Exophiala xenobiotica]KAK5212575.1 hypothetical protein LTR41_001521 [Exophiala xenobiotica]KAK5414772.1 hypothetical protein LTR06_004587 [Exophiala xenobiotica]